MMRPALSADVTPNGQLLLTWRYPDGASGGGAMIELADHPPVRGSDRWAY